MAGVSKTVADLHRSSHPCEAVDGSDLREHWWGGWGSNPRPKDYESSALTG